MQLNEAAECLGIARPGAEDQHGIRTGQTPVRPAQAPVPTNEVSRREAFVDSYGPPPEASTARRVQKNERLNGRYSPREDSGVLRYGHCLAPPLTWSGPA